MSDLKLVWTGQGFDLALTDNDLQRDDSLQTAVLVSLFSDRRARADDALPGNDSDRRGWWGDTWPVVPGDQIGSRLWLLSREKDLPEVKRLARDYAREALAWLIEDGLALAVEVSTGVPRRGWLHLRVDIEQRDGRHSTYNYEWEYA